MHKLEVLQSSWGIAIWLYARIVDNDHNKNWLTIYEDQFDSILLENHQLKAFETHFIKGLQRVRKQLDEDKPIGKILVEKMEFNWCDFQDNAVEVVFTEWLADQLLLKRPECEFEYLKSENRYLIRWK